MPDRPPTMLGKKPPPAPPPEPQRDNAGRRATGGLIGLPVWIMVLAFIAGGIAHSLVERGCATP